MTYVFEAAKSSDIPFVFDIIKNRVEWMETKGLKQWNTTDYLNVYPISYFESHLNKGNLYVLRSSDSSVLGLMVLLPKDVRWDGYDLDDSYFVHNFATVLDTKGLGPIMLREAEKLAASHGKKYLRLDCPSDNAYLNLFYESKGYVPAGTCVDGLYHGNRKEKKLF